MNSGREHENPEDEDPVKIIDDIVDLYGDIQANLSAGAAIAGEERERFLAMREPWADLMMMEPEDPDYSRVLASGAGTLAAHRNELSEFSLEPSRLLDRIDDIALSSDATASTTGGTISVMSNGPVEVQVQATLPRHSRAVQTEERLRKLDPGLARTYASVREVLYGTSSDPERSSLFQTRQVFDHLFSLLAPDYLVRESRFWSPKAAPERRDHVTRRERIMFAAHVHILDPPVRALLIEGAGNMVDVYKALSNAHKRGPLDSSRAREALREAATLIERWIWAVRLPLSFEMSST